MPSWIPGPDDDDDDRFASWRDKIVNAFERVIPADEPEIDPGDLGLLLDWKRSYGDARFDCWRRSDLEEFLLDWCPAKLSATAEQVRSLPRSVALAAGFLADQGLLKAGSEPLEALVRHAIGLQDAFMTAMDDPANFGMAKSLFAGVDLDVDALIGGPSSEASLEDIVVGPVVLPDDRTLRRAALASPVVTAFVQLGDFFAAPGRLLTKSGNLKLVDARALVELLGTGDTFREPGDGEAWQTSTRSASQLPVLDHWKRWASEAGVLRSRQGRLVAVEAWRKRARKDPLHELLEGLHLLVDAGPLQSYRSWFTTPVLAALDSSVGPLLGRLLEAPQGHPYDDLVEQWTALLLEMRISEYFPGHLQHDFSQLVDVLDRVGVVLHHQAATSTTATGGHLRVGGSLALTPVGVRFAVDLLTEQGVTVQVVPAPEAQTVAGLVSLFTQVEPDAWWRSTTSWLDVQPDDTAALVALLSDLERADDPALVLAGLDSAPDEAVGRLVAALRHLVDASDPAAADLPLLAAAWLDRHGQLEGPEVDADAVIVGSLIALGRLAASSPELMIDALVTSDQAHDSYAFIQLVAQLLPPYAVELLEAMGQGHPDKAVAKAARKQLFRTRSRLVQQSRSGTRS